MQRKTACARLAGALLLTLFGTGLSHASYLPLPEQDRGDRVAVQTVRGDIVAQSRLYCLALAVYFEGGSTGESEDGQRHIARVVVSRARADRPQWGGSDICDVVFYKKTKVCQFSFTCLPLARRTPRAGAAWDFSVWIAMQELAGDSDVEEQSLRYYMNASLSRPEYACRFRKEFVRVTQAGRHEFFREATRAERAELEKMEHEDCTRYKRVLAEQKAKLKRKAAKAKRYAAAGKKKLAKRAKTKYASR